MRTYFIAVLLAGMALLAGCATSHVLVGEPRPPISPDKVKVYLSPPGVPFEEIALVEASSRGAWAVSDQGKTNAAIERLKEEAASLGANGILLRGTGSQSNVSVGTSTATYSGNSSYGTGVGVGVVHKTASAVAIYIQESEAQ